MKEKDQKIENTAETYDDCIGKVNKEEVVTLFDDEPIVPQTEEEAWEQLHWEEAWKGMPSYQSDNLVAAKKLIVNFSSEEDFNDFCQKLGFEHVSMSTKSTFYPERKPNNMSIFRWIDESELEDNE